MEEVHLMSYLWDENPEELRNYRYKYSRDSTIVAYTNEEFRIWSNVHSLIERSEWPLQSHQNQYIKNSPKQISDIFCFEFGVYVVHIADNSRSFFKRNKDTVFVYLLDQIKTQDSKFEFDNPIVCHSDLTTIDDANFLVVLTNSWDLSFFKIASGSKENSTDADYELNISYCLEKVRVESAKLLPIHNQNIVGLQINSSHLLLFDFNNKSMPLKVDFRVK